MNLGVNELKPGDYRAVWCTKGEIIAAWNFQVSEDKLASKN